MRHIIFLSLIFALAVSSSKCKPEEVDLPDFNCSYSNFVPQNNSSGWNTNLTLRWGGCSQSSSFQVQLSSQADFSNLLLDVRTTDSTYDVSLQASSVYYWRVRGLQDELLGPWSSTYKFSTVGANVLPSITLDTIFPGGPWENIKLPFPVYNLHPIQAPSRYRLQVSHDSAYFFSPTSSNPFDTLLGSGESIYAGRYRTSSGYNSNWTYYWRYRVEVNGVPGAWSPIYSFTTQDMRDIIVGTYRVKKYKAWSGYHPQEGICPSSLCRIDMGETDIVITKLNTANDEIRVQELPGGVVNDFWYNPSTGGSYYIPSALVGSAKAYFNYYLDSFKIEYDWRRSNVQDYGYLFMAPNPYR